MKKPDWVKCEIILFFYILDEEGNPIPVEITQSDLDGFSKEDEESFIMTLDETETPEEVISIVRFNRNVTTINFKEADTG